MTNLKIGDIVKPIGQTWEKELEAIKTTKEGTTFLVGGLWWREENLALIQPVGTDWKVGAMVRFTNTVRDHDFVIGKIERFGNSNYRLFPDEYSHTCYIASYCKLIATDKCPEANKDWTGKIVRRIHSNYRLDDVIIKIGDLFVVERQGMYHTGESSLHLVGVDAALDKDRFELVGGVPQSLTLNNIVSSTYEETIQKQSEENKKLTTRIKELEKQNQEMQILVNRIKKLKELVTPVAQILDI